MKAPLRISILFLNEFSFLFGLTGILKIYEMYVDILVELSHFVIKCILVISRILY